MALDFSAKPYFDDYAKEKGFHKILFKPGISVQARELNQLQEMLNQQISRLGSHVFKNGSLVIPGQSRLNIKAYYVILNNDDSDPDILTKLMDKKLYQTIESTNLEATVIQTYALGSHVLAIINYANSAVKTVGGEVENVTTFSADLSIAVEDEPLINISIPLTGPSAEPNVGRAAFLTVDTGVFYVDEYFVHTQTQNTLLGWNFSTLDVKAGFIVEKNIVTAYDDVSLFDNALGAPNEGAPGADRFSINLRLATLPLTDEDTNVIELVRIENNNLRVSKQYAQYSVLEETLARRTYDESGDYSTFGLDIKVYDHLKDDRNPNGFRTVEDGGDDNLMAIEVGPGKAYVKGYEIENLSSTYLEVDKARTLDSVKFSNDVIQVNENGEYIFLAPGNEFIDISRHPIIWLTNGQESTAAIIGYCVPKHLESISISGQTIFKLYGSFFLSQSATYGWQHLGGWRLDALKNGPVLQKLSLETVVSNFVVNDGLPLTSHTGYTPYAWDATNKALYVKKAFTAPVFNTTIQVVKASASGYVSTITFKETFADGTGDLVKLNISNIKTTRDALGNLELQADMGYTFLLGTDANGYGVFNYLGDGVFTGQPVAAHTTIDNAYFANIVNISNEGKTLTINNVAYPNALFAVSANLRKTVVVKSKTLAEGTTAINAPSSRLMALAHKDVYKIKHVYVSPNLSTPAVDTDTDIGEYYELSNNDTLDFYQNTFLKAKTGFTIPSGRLLVVYDYFLHGSGEAFTVDSYVSLRDNPVDESDVTHIGRIPTFSTKERTYILSDYLDFRQSPRDGFFILKGTVTTGSPNIAIEHDYTNVIVPTSLIFSNGFTSTATVLSIDSTKIVASENSTYTGTIYAVVNVNTATSAAEPFFSPEKRLWAPISGQSIQFDAAYFVDRWDKVVYFKNNTIRYIYGVPGVTRYPETPIDAMSLATLIVPAYTRQATFVKYKKEDNRRYTMRDIGKLERRIENLEYYTTLSLKELETKDLKIVDTNGLDRFKSGFFVSDFRDFGVFSPFDGGFKSTLVPEENMTIPLEYTDSIDLNFNQTESTNFVIRGDKIFMPYTHVVQVEQPYGTSSETINPYLIIAWNPAMNLTPAVDNWIETEWAPSVTNVTNLSNTIVNESTVINASTNVLDSSRSVSGFFGVSAPENTVAVIGQSTADVSSSLASTSTSITNTSRSSSNRLLGTSVIPFMRSKTIRFSVKGSKPNTRYWAAFDAVDVNHLCRPVNTSTLVTGAWGAAIVSDPMGDIMGDFQLPPARFSVGARTLSLTDINLLEFPDAGTECEASAVYTANGTLRTMQEVINITNSTVNTVNNVTTVNRVTTVQRQTTLFQNQGFEPAPPPPPAPPIVVRPFVFQQQGGQGGRGGGDPLAQSFSTYNVASSGMYLTKVDIYFRKKDPVAPVFLELREMQNGMPVNDLIPGSMVGLNPSQVTVSEDSTIATAFVFDKPIFIPTNREYCFILSGPSSRYHVWISKLGEKVINEERIVGEQPSLGSLFKSQNASTWTPFQLEDLKFRLHRAKFDTYNSGDWVFENNGIAAIRRVLLGDFYTTSGSKFITVKHPNHGMEVNGVVRIQSEEAIGSVSNSASSIVVFNNIPMSEIYANHIIKEVVDINHYKIEVTTSANKTGYFEDVGRYVYIDGNINFYMYRLLADEFSTPECTVRYFANLITGKDFDGGQTPKVLMQETQINNTDTNALQDVALVQTALNETSKSMKFRAAVTTVNDYVCPVFSLEGNSAIVSSLALNKPATDLEYNAVMDAGNVSSKVITQVIRLKTAADSIRIYTSECKMESDDIQVYYRTAINRDLDEKTWTVLAPETSAISYDNETYIEHERRIDGLPEFDEFQIKIVLKGTNSVRRPSLKELRAIAVAG